MFEPDINLLIDSRSILTVGDASIQSYPMNIKDHYCDLLALKYFLAQRTLSTIILGNEPVGAVKFLNEGELASLTPYRRRGEKAISQTFTLSQGVNEINSVLNAIATLIPSDTLMLERRVADDIISGVYDDCLE